MDCQKKLECLISLGEERWASRWKMHLPRTMGKSLEDASSKTRDNWLGCLFAGNQCKRNLGEKCHNGSATEYERSLMSMCAGVLGAKVWSMIQRGGSF